MKKPWSVPVFTAFTKAIFLLSVLLVGAVEAATDTFTASGTWTAPAGVNSVDVEVWGGGGAGGGQNMNSDGGGGGGGGAYSKTVAVPVIPGNSYAVTVGAGGVGVAAGTGGTGGDSYFINAATVMAKGGAGGAPSTGTPPPGGLGGAAAAGVGTTKFSGGNGGTGRNNTTGRGGPGGSSAGTAANGTSGPVTWATATAAAAPVGGGIGGNGGNANGQNGFAPASGNGGGGGGAAEGTNIVGGVGAGGKISLTYTLPSVTSINLAAASPTNAASVSWTVIFSTSVTGVSSSNFVPVNVGLGGTPAITGVSGGGTTWTVTASTGTGSGTLGLNMVNSTGLSVAPTNLPFTGQVYAIDKVSPTVSSITRVNPTPTALASVSWTVTFSENVTGVDASDFALAQAYGMSGALITGVTPVSGTVYTVTASTGIGNGTLGLNLVDDNSIADAVLNPLGGAVVGDGNFSGEVYDVYITSATGSPTACVNVATIGTIAWGTLTGPLANDNVVYATASVNDNQITNYLQCTGYGFAIPVGATINGITVNVDRKASGTLIRDAAMRLVMDVAGVATIQATDRATLTDYTTVDVSEAHGGATDLWLGTWAPADINSVNFGAALASTKAGATGGARTVSVDHMSITVDYSLPVNCTSKASGNWNVPATWVMCRGGIPLAGDTVTIAAGHTVTQNINTPAIGTLTINGTLGNTANTLTVAGDVLINAGGAYSGGSGAVSTTGNFSNSGAFTSGSGTWTFNGAAAQSITGATNFQNLALNNASGLTLNDAVTASTVLTLTSGAITTGANILSASANCPASIVRTGGFVVGNLRLTFPAGATTCRFPVGSGSVYAPIDLTTPAGSAGGTMTGSTTGNEHPNVANSPVDSSKDVNRFWTLSGDTIGASPYVATFNFVTGDVDIGASPGGFVLGRYAGAWTAPASPTPFALSITASLTGPIVGATDFVAGEAGFVCSVPAGSPVGTTCVCDNFNRVSLNPSTMFPGANWNVSTSGGTFGLPRIVNNRLRLTDNTGNVATAATAPGTYPAKGNWISVEFKHYAYSGTGADGIAFTLSDALIAAAPGAFGGSLGYAQKTGIDGFTGGWVGIGIDEYGNFSSNTEGRAGGTAPGLTLDSVAVRGSGSGQIGYPYLGGTGTLTPPIDAPTPAVAGLGHAYRLTVDARGYTWNGATGTKSTLVSVERDTTGTGTSYTPLVPAFDAYVANASQADVPTDWQLSFTGSTGGSTNIHEIIGLKVCAQTIVPPAGYRIQVDNMTPTTCPSDPQPTVTISALNANGQVMTTYTNTVDLAATLASGGGGGASSATWISQGTNQGTWDSVNKRYTFAAGDNGVAKFYLSDLVQQNVYITVSEYLGTLNSSLAAPVYFSSGAASFAVSTPDALGDGVVAGRPHLMRVSRNTVGCGGGVDAGFIGVKPLDGWYNPAAGDHPSGANAPQICMPVSGACLPYGSCQTLSIAPPVVDGASNNLSLTFTAGVADFCLVTSDVGKYSVGLRDDSVATGTPAVTGTSTTLTARPFAVVASDVKQGATNNPANGTSGGSIFAKAGTDFQTTVAGYLWNSAGDTGGNGLPGAAANWAAITAAGIAPSYADTVLLAAVAPFAPAAGVLSNGSVAVVSGSTTTTTLSYNEVGSFTLTATAAASYLNSGVNLGNRVAIFSNPDVGTYRGGLVGRFIPDHFDTSVVLSTGVPMPCLAGINPATSLAWTCPASNDVQDGFVYSGQSFSVQVIATNLAGIATANYVGSYARDVTLAAWDALGSTATQNPFGSLANGSITAAMFGAGVAVASTPVYTLTAVTTAPTDIYLRAVDTDNVTSLRATPSSSIEGGVKVANGRVRIGNAYGSELLQLPMMATIQYYNGTIWVTSATDDVTLFNSNLSTAGGNLVATIVPGSEPSFGVVVSSPGIAAVIDGVRTFRLSAPGARGSANISFNAPTYLPSNTARATFGVYRGRNEFIYMRESY